MKFEIIRASSGVRPHARPVEIAQLEERGGRPVWTVDLDGLDDLLTLGAYAQADLIIGQSHSEDRLPTITVYDDYME